MRADGTWENIGWMK
ncbi:hypothetical protein OSK71_25850 [Escherichia coli]|nr:hypothetical protein [Escherichia coli]MDA6380245.1 hypothetical protein [Escherichia coli]